MSTVPPEFDIPAAHGFTMAGWNFSSLEVRQAIAGHRMLNPAVELGTNVCPWNCDFCFTESILNPDGKKRKLQNELPIDRRLDLIDELADLGAKSINFVGAGEPTIEPHFWELIKKMTDRDILPIIYTEGSLKLSTPSFTSQLFDSGATVVLKVNSLKNRDYQDAILRGTKPKAGVPEHSYFSQREKALENLLSAGFNKSIPTRLAFDCIMCRENADEVPEIHRYARKANIFVIFVNYLPSGRTANGHIGSLSWNEQYAIFQNLAKIDETEFGISHATHFPYSGGVPCTIRGLGLYIKIGGQVFDCPGESLALGNVNDTPLDRIWSAAKSITSGFNGECLPRQLFWKRIAAQGMDTPQEPR